MEYLTITLLSVLERDRGLILKHSLYAERYSLGRMSIYDVRLQRFQIYVPKERSPASPKPGTIYPLLLSPSSIIAV